MATHTPAWFKERAEQTRLEIQSWPSWMREAMVTVSASFPVFPPNRKNPK